jgi:hypothetical protein
MSLAVFALIFAGAFLLLYLILVFGLLCYAAGTMPDKYTDEDIDLAARKFLRALFTKRSFVAVFSLFVGAAGLGLVALAFGA